MFSHIFRGAYDLVFPNNCILCRAHIKTDRSHKILCQSCESSLEPNKPPFCRHCWRHLEAADPTSLCQECLQGRHYFSRVWAAAVYNDPMKHLIHLFKYGSKTSLKNLFSSLILSFVKNYNIDMQRYDLVAPIPLYPTRLRERGYNQSQLLAGLLAQEFRIKPSYENLRRIRHTKNQALLGKKERLANISGAFSIQDAAEFRQKSVLLVDDLLTTG